jgi:hypothetical protein
MRVAGLPFCGWFRGVGAFSAAFLACAIFGAVGCSTNSVPAAAPVPGVISGNWEFAATSSVYGATPLGIFFSTTAGAVTGTAQAQAGFDNVCGPCCGGNPFAGVVPKLSGTIDNNGNLALKSTPATDGSVFSVTAKVSSAGVVGSGTYTIGGGCWKDSGTISGNELPLLSGTYSGTVTSTNTGKTYAVSANLGQTSALNSRGFLQVTGSVAFTGYSCITTATVDQGIENNGFLGTQFQAGLDSTNPISAGGSIEGALSSDGKSIAFTYVAGGPGTGCALDAGQGTLTL